MKSWMLPPGRQCFDVSRSTLVPAPILFALNTLAPPLAIACTVPSVVTSLFNFASTVLFWLRLRNTFSSVSLPAPALLMVMV